MMVKVPRWLGAALDWLFGEQPHSHSDRKKPRHGSQGPAGADPRWPPSMRQARGKVIASSYTEVQEPDHRDLTGQPSKSGGDGDLDLEERSSESPRMDKPSSESLPEQMSSSEIHIFGRVVNLEQRLRNLERRIDRNIDDLSNRIDIIEDAARRNSPGGIGLVNTESEQAFSQQSSHEKRSALDSSKRLRDTAPRQAQPAMHQRSSASLLEVATDTFRELSSERRDLQPLVASLESALRSQVGIKHLGRHSGHEWSLAVLQPHGGEEGVVVVCPGHVAEGDIPRFFNVEHGRRIKEFREPALVRATNGDFEILQKGRVKSS